MAVWALPGAGRMHAADIESKTITVPFAFQVNNTMLPAGPYRVEQTIGKQLMFIVNMQTGHRIPVMRDRVSDGSVNATLTFEKTSQGYRLSRIS
jgi:hypothetical protein